MKRSIFLQLLGFSIFILNHIYYIIIAEKPVILNVQIATVALIPIVSLILWCDYYFNFKKNGQFKFSSSTLIIMNTGMWLLNGFYWFAGLNLFLFITFLWYERRLKVKEDA